MINSRPGARSNSYPWAKKTRMLCQNYSSKISSCAGSFRVSVSHHRNRYRIGVGIGIGIERQYRYRPRFRFRPRKGKNANQALVGAKHTKPRATPWEDMKSHFSPESYSGKSQVFFGAYVMPQLRKIVL